MNVTDATSGSEGLTGSTDSTKQGASPTSSSEWLRRFSETLGVPVPTAEEIDALLGLAGIAAHASERTAAPLSTWLAGRSGVRPGEARDLAARLAGTLPARGGG